ncbi:tetratricopeptide repeat protein, partial [Rhodopirellula bahusiensis]
EAALLALPAKGVARMEVLRLLAEAHLRQGDARSAAAILRETATTLQATTDPVSSSESVRALQVRVALSAGDLQTAERMLNAVYGSDPIAANAGAGMDLVRLRFLLAKQDERSVADWLESIRERHGANAKDRADTIVAQTRVQLGIDSSSPPADGSDPRLWIADAMYYLRRGQHMQSALHFAKAAASDDVASRSVDSALKAAAILSRQSNSKAAIELLRRISQRHPNSVRSADALLQAATIGQAAGPSVASESDVKAMLIQIAKQWPESQSAFAATRWRMNWAEQNSDWLEAAKISVEFAEVHWTSDVSTPESVREQAIRAWTIAWMREPSAEVISLMHQSFHERDHIEIVRRTHADLTCLLTEISDTHWSELQNQTSEGFYHKLRGFRQTQTDSIQAPPPTGLSRVLAERLELDVVLNPARRVAVGRYLLSLPPDSDFPTDIQRAGWLIWSGQRDDAEELISTKMQRSPSEADEWCRRAATSYAVSQSKSDQKHAATWWKRLADGLQQGTPAWHTAMVGWIRAVAASGETEKAKASAKMILLTMPPTDLEVRQSYESISQ